MKRRLPFRNIRAPRKTGSIQQKALFILPVIVLAGFFVYSGLYQVPAESVGVVLRFGKVHEEVQPGLRFKLPFGVDTVRLVPVERQLKQEYGFGTAGATNPTQYSQPDEWPRESDMVTGDLNSVLVEWIIQYRIATPVQFLFNVRNPELTLRDVSESVMREVVGDQTVDEVLTVGRQEIENEALLKMQGLLDKYEMGIRISQVQLKSVNPPRPVQASFDEVNKAKQEKEKLINVANGEYNRVVPRASGEAEQKIQEAQGYAAQRVNEAEGDVAAFNALLIEYLKAPEITKQRIYLETMGEVLDGLKSKVILDDEAKQILPLLNLNDSLPGVRK